MMKVTIFAIVACLVVTSALAQNNDELNKTKPEAASNEKQEQTLTQGAEQPQDGGPGSGRQFPSFNTEGSLAPLPQPQGPQGLIPGYQGDGLPGPGFNPYASPQLGFGGYYPQIPLQPQQPQGYPGQPQIVYYSGTGQPFLVNPGNPPGNFLIPQFPQQPGAGQPVDPNIFNTQPVYPPLTPQNPQTPQLPPQNPGVFLGGGYPKQPVIPPIDKDAEEIPKNIPMQGNVAGIGPNPNVPKKTQKPQKLELDGSDDTDEGKPAQPSGNTPQGQPGQPGIGNVPNLLNLRPGQRFFILNGQPLFSNYPGFGYQHPNLVPERYATNPYAVRPQQFYQQRPQDAPGPQGLQHQQFEQRFKPVGSSLSRIILRDQPEQLVRQFIVPEHLKHREFPQLTDGLPLTLHNQVVGKSGLQSVLLAPVAPGATTKDALQSRYYEKTIPFDEHQIPLQQDQVQPVFDAEPAVNFDYYKYNDAAEDAAIIIDAKYQEPNEVEDDAEGETEKPAESSVAEAQPGAIALAGEGGVAAAGPRATALAGQGGLAVSSPHATAVAGPAKDDAPASSTAEDKKKPATATKAK